MVLSAALLGAPALADPAPTVSAQGTASLQKMPTIMRVTLELTATEKDAPAAVAKLAQMRDTATKKLAELKAIDGSVKVGDASVGAASNLTPQQQQMQAMINMSRGGKKPAPAKTVTVSATVKAAFALSGASADDVLLKSQALEEQLKTNLKFAAATTKPSTPEEQEMAEELAGQDENAGMPGAAKPGEPSFTYVFPVSDEDAKKLTADAITNARNDANLLATAAGMKLGLLHELSSGAAESKDNPYAEYISAMSEAVTAKPDAGVREAVGTQPGAVSYTVTVSATFDMVAAAP